MPHISEYEVETKFIDRLESIGYQYAELGNYDDVLANCREQLAAFNAAKLKETNGVITDSLLDGLNVYHTLAGTY